MVRPAALPASRDTARTFALGSYEEADRLLAAAAPHLYRLVLFLLLSGARLGEALGLRWDDIDLAAGWVVFRNTKRGKRGGRAGEDRGAPLHPQLVVMLANLARPRNGDGFVFLSSRGEPYAARLGGGHIKTAWAAALRRAGIEVCGCMTCATALRPGC